MGRVHGRAILDLGMELCAIVDCRSEASVEAAETLELRPEALCSDVDEMLTSIRPEFVIVATTTPSHCESTCRAAGAGARYILCEKPMAASLAQCDRMIEACHAAGTRLGINYSGRFRPAFRKVREFLMSDSFDGLTSMTAVGGNAGLAMNGTHLIESFMNLAGEPVEEVTAWLDEVTLPNPRGTGFEDRSGVMRLTTKNGRRLMIDLGSDQGHGMVVTYAGRTGWCVEDVLGGRLRASWRRAGDWELPTTRYATPGETDDIQVSPTDTLELAKAMITALIEGRDYVDGTAGRKPIEALVAAYVSHENGHAAVHLDDNLPGERVFSWA